MPLELSVNFKLSTHVFCTLIILYYCPHVNGQSGGWTNWFLRVAVEPELELCGSLNFYCLSTNSCVSRDERCAVGERARNSCPHQRRCYSTSWNPKSNFAEPNLDEMDHRFFVYRAYSSILESGFSGSEKPPKTPELGASKKLIPNTKRKRNVKQALRTLIFDPWKHSFVQYMGFVYEFGKYGVQELDLNDPNYKYEREWTAGWQIVAVSRCSRSDLWRFIRKWNFFRANYLWYANNCHHFTNAFVKYLNSDCLIDHDNHY